MKTLDIAKALQERKDRSAWDKGYGACSLIYDEDIAKRLCTPSELKRTNNGDRNPSSRETWLDMQARALSVAFRRICSIIYFNER